jgi:uncharacterized YigZ family protein
MGEPRLVPAREVRYEIRVVNSRFIATAGPALTMEDARSLLARMRREFPDATHHVPAFIIGHGNTVISHCHDDGEPSGTAGRPALAVLQGSGLGDVAVVVTRYYGGTKLGTGGLVRAYGDAVRSVLEIMPRARKIATQTFAFAVPYAAFERVRRLIGIHHGEIINQEFGAEVELTSRIALEDFGSFQDALKNASNGPVNITILETNPNTFLPLSTE